MKFPHLVHGLIPCLAVWSGALASIGIAAEPSPVPKRIVLLAGGLLGRSETRAVRDNAAKFLPTATSNNERQLPPLDVLVRLDGDAGRGANLFSAAATCDNCHVVDGNGKQVGPNLSKIGDKLSREALDTAILDPSAGISHNDETHIALTDDGRIVTGLLVAQTDQRVVLRNAEAIDIEIAADELIELRRSEKLMMPEGLHLVILQQQLIDPVSYLTTLKKRSRITLSSTID